MRAEDARRLRGSGSFDHDYGDDERDTAGHGHSVSDRVDRAHAFGHGVSDRVSDDVRETEGLRSEGSRPPDAGALRLPAAA